MGYHTKQTTILGWLFTVVLLMGFSAAEWEVLNADTENRNDDLNFMPVSPKSSSLAKRTFQSSPSQDSFSQFQDLTFPKRRLMSSAPVPANHNLKSNSNRLPKTHSETKQKHHIDTLPSHSNENDNSNNKIDKNSLKINQENRKQVKITTPKPQIEEINVNDNDDLLNDAKEFQILRSEDSQKMKKTKKMRVIVREEEHGEIDCEDEINLNEYDCLHIKEQGRFADEANISEAGDQAREELLEFMELGHRHKRAVEDTGSGAGPVYPDDENIVDGNYTVSVDIIFDTNVNNNTEDLQKFLQEKLEKAFKSIPGFRGVVVTAPKNENGTVSARWTLSVKGRGIGAFGSNSVDVANGLQFQLLNLSKPLYDSIEIGGVNPRDPLNANTIATTLANNLENICSTETPCSGDFGDCTVTGYDEGKCVHKCKAFESERACEHGGYCELQTTSSGNSVASCQCSSNWDGQYCQNRKFNGGEIGGMVVGAAVLALSLIGCCCWFLLCRRRRKALNMTYFGDDSDSSERFSNPSSKISTFVIDRPRIRTDPIRQFSPYNQGDFSRPSTFSTGPPRRQPPTLFSDA